MESGPTLRRLGPDHVRDCLLRNRRDRGPLLGRRILHGARRDRERERFRRDKLSDASDGQPRDPVHSPTPPPGSAGVRIAPCAQGSSAVPGTTQSTPLIVTNAGTANDTIDLAFSASPGWSGDWYASDDATRLGDSDGDGLPDTGFLEPGASIDVFLRMTIPVNATGSQTVNVTGTSTVDPSIDDTSMIGFSFPIALFDPPQSDVGLDVNRNGQFDSLDVNIT